MVMKLRTFFRKIRSLFLLKICYDDSESDSYNIFIDAMERGSFPEIDISFIGYDVGPTVGQEMKEQGSHVLIIDDGKGNTLGNGGEIHWMQGSVWN
jgi:hypothetical protein